MGLWSVKITCLIATSEIPTRFQWFTHCTPLLATCAEVWEEPDTLLHMLDFFLLFLYLLLKDLWHVSCVWPKATSSLSSQREWALWLVFGDKKLILKLIKTWSIAYHRRFIWVPLSSILHVFPQCGGYYIQLTPNQRWNTSPLISQCTPTASTQHWLMRMEPSVARSTNLSRYSSSFT